MNHTELTTELASEISRLHQEAEGHATNAKGSMEAALFAAVACGEHLNGVETMTKGKMLGWLRDNVPNLTPERAKGYLSIFHVHQNREEHLIDHRQLLLLGVIEHQERTPQERTQSEGIEGSKWVSWVSNIQGFFSKRRREYPVERWTSEEKDAVRNQLKPLVDFYQSLQ